jgi:tRNA-splicing ligase RtcB (3'-phosphate/5'-hydroxy nucleic acid ligase)
MFREIFEPERGQRVPVRIWGRNIAPDTVRQLQQMASQPYVVEFVAAMADAHVANGVAVGTVFATEHTVVPRALGGDLGCGMSAIKTNIDASSINRRTLEEIISVFGRAIPTGSATHRGQGISVPDEVLSTDLSTRALEHTREALARRHLGTLGGGNHFLELDRDADQNLWVLVHSGSRGLGAAIAAHHAEAARSVGDSHLTGLDTNEENGAAYLTDLSWALDFARANRIALAHRAQAIMTDIFHETVERIDELDIHHNFVSREKWRDRELLVHRKGAVSVPVGARALVPGSMGTASYVVEGLGCEDAFGSCSHGAGRVMSRTDARRKVRPKALAETMRRIVYPEELLKQLVEEAPSAYRDITEVLEDQEDLVKRRVRLEPIAVLKG